MNSILGRVWEPSDIHTFWTASTAPDQWLDLVSTQLMGQRSLPLLKVVFMAPRHLLLAVLLCQIAEPLGSPACKGHAIALSDVVFVGKIILSSYCVRERPPGTLMGCYRSITIKNWLSPLPKPGIICLPLFYLIILATTKMTTSQLHSMMWLSLYSSPNLCNF